MSIKLPIPGPKLREEAIRAAQAIHDALSECESKKEWAIRIETLERIDQEQKEKGG